MIGRRPVGPGVELAEGVEGVENAAVLSLRPAGATGGAGAEAEAVPEEADAAAAYGARGEAGTDGGAGIDVRGGGGSGAPNDGVTPPDDCDAPPPGAAPGRSAPPEVPGGVPCGAGADRGGVVRDAKGGVRCVTPPDVGVEPPPADRAAGLCAAARAAVDCGGVAVKSSTQRTLSPTGMMPPHTEQRARRAVLVIFAGSRRKTVWQSGQETFIEARWRGAPPRRSESIWIRSRGPGGGPQRRPTRGESSRTPSSRWQVRSPGREL